MRLSLRIIVAIAAGTISACVIGPKQEDPTVTGAEDTGVVADSEAIDPYLDGALEGDTGEKGPDATAGDSSTAGDTAIATPPCAPSDDAGDASACDASSSTDAADDAAPIDAADALGDGTATDVPLEDVSFDAPDAPDALDGDEATGG